MPNGCSGPPGDDSHNLGFDSSLHVDWPTGGKTRESRPIFFKIRGPMVGELCRKGRAILSIPQSRPADGRKGRNVPGVTIARRVWLRISGEVILVDERGGPPTRGGFFFV